MVGLGNILNALKNSKPVVRFFEGSVGNAAKLFGMKPAPLNSALKLSQASIRNIFQPTPLKLGAVTLLGGGLVASVAFKSIGGLTGPVNIAETEKKFKGGVLEGKIPQVIQIAAQEGVPAAFLISVLALESAYGKSKAAKQYNNVSGSMDPKTKSMTFLKFKDVLESVRFTARNLSKNYIKQGRITPQSIGAKYSPPGAANDPNKTNGLWPSLVTKLMNVFSAGAAGAQQFVQNVISNPLQVARSLATNSINGIGSFLGGILNNAQKSLASVAKSVAQVRNTVGYCLGGVNQAMQKAFGIALPFKSAYMAAPALAKRTDKFKEVKVTTAQDIKNLPTGTVLVWPKTGRSPHGHIEVKTSPTHAASDHVAPVITQLRDSPPSAVRAFIPT
jgi:hypothetical protein